MMQIFGVTVWGDPPLVPLRQSVQERLNEHERELVKLHLDQIDMNVRKVGMEAKIEYLKKYLADRPYDPDGSERAKAVIQGLAKK